MVSGLQNEVELIPTCASMFKMLHNTEEITACPNHCSQLGIEWSQGSNMRCIMSKEISCHKEKLP